MHGSPWNNSISVVLKGIHSKTHLGFSFILQCTGTIYKNSRTWHYGDPCIFTVYAKEMGKALIQTTLWPSDYLMTFRLPYDLQTTLWPQHHEKCRLPFVLPVHTEEWHNLVIVWLITVMTSRCQATRARTAHFVRRKCTYINIYIIYIYSMGPFGYEHSWI